MKKVIQKIFEPEDWGETLTEKEIESIKKGLKDISENRIHSHETAREIYAKYL